ncbi:hypothetical protein [Caenispirillum bisanense]|uniref:hypothetical protein n=1 Tax=Caenispirillum bisanense TaxID=414052 RepID=UPI0031D70F64
MSDNREMYSEINALIGGLAKAFEIDDKAVVADLEAGRISLDMAADENGNRYIAATRGDRTARLYQGAIQYDRPPGEGGGSPAGEG